jgi:hypothetical protein
MTSSSRFLPPDDTDLVVGLLNDNVYTDLPAGEQGFDLIHMGLTDTLMAGVWGDGNTIDLDAPLSGWDSSYDGMILDQMLHPDGHYLPRDQPVEMVQAREIDYKQEDHLQADREHQIQWEMASSEAQRMNDLEGDMERADGKRPEEDPKIYAQRQKLWRRVQIIKKVAVNAAVREELYGKIHTAIDSKRTPASKSKLEMEEYQKVIEKWIRHEWGPMAHVAHSRVGLVLKLDKKNRLALVQMVENEVFQTAEDALIEARRKLVRDDNQRQRDDTETYRLRKIEWDKHAVAAQQHLSDLQLHSQLIGPDSALLKDDVDALNAESGTLEALIHDLTANADLRVDDQEILNDDLHNQREDEAILRSDAVITAADALVPAKDKEIADADDALLVATEARRHTHELAMKSAQAQLDLLQAAGAGEAAIKAQTLQVTITQKDMITDETDLSNGRAAQARHSAEAAQHIKDTNKHIADADQHAKDHRDHTSAMQDHLRAVQLHTALTPQQLDAVNNAIATFGTLTTHINTDTLRLINDTLDMVDDLTLVSADATQKLYDASQQLDMLFKLEQNKERLRVDAEYLAQVIIDIEALRKTQWVRTGAGTPVVKHKYMVHFPFTLTAAPTSLLRGPKAWDQPWLLAPAGQTWLYYMGVRDDASEQLTLWRVALPPNDPTFKYKNEDATKIHLLPGSPEVRNAGTQSVSGPGMQSTTLYLEESAFERSSRPEIAPTTYPYPTLIHRFPDFGENGEELTIVKPTNPFIHAMWTNMAEGLDTDVLLGVARRTEEQPNITPYPQNHGYRQIQDLATSVDGGQTWNILQRGLIMAKNVSVFYTAGGYWIQPGGQQWWNEVVLNTAGWVNGADTPGFGVAGDRVETWLIRAWTEGPPVPGDRLPVPLQGDFHANQVEQFTIMVWNTKHWKTQVLVSKNGGSPTPYDFSQPAGWAETCILRPTGDGGLRAYWQGHERHFVTEHHLSSDPSGYSLTYDASDTFLWVGELPAASGNWAWEKIDITKGPNRIVHCNQDGSVALGALYAGNDQVRDIQSHWLTEDGGNTWRQLPLPPFFPWDPPNYVSYQMQGWLVDTP